MARLVRARPAAMDDARDIFDWRNDPVTRAMSVAGEIIVWEEHCRWLARSLADKGRLLLICESLASPGGQKCAVVVFDCRDRERAVVSVNLAPAMRGQGLAPPCLEEAIFVLRDRFPDVRLLEARIKPINQASQRSFARVGFRRTGTETDLLIYTLDLERMDGC